MTNSADDFEGFVHSAVHESMDKNARFWEMHGKYGRWDWDADEITLNFSDPDKLTLKIHVAVIGTTRGERWQWTWANQNFEANSKLGVEKIRDFGLLHGYDQLTTPFIDADEHTGWEMTSVAVHLLNALGSYRFPTDEGHCYLAFLKIDMTSVQ